MTLSWRAVILIYSAMLGVIISTSLLLDSVIAFTVMILSSIIIVLVLGMSPKEKTSLEVKS